MIMFIAFWCVMFVVSCIIYLPTIYFILKKIIDDKWRVYILARPAEESSLRKEPIWSNDPTNTICKERT